MAHWGVGQVKARTFGSMGAWLCKALLQAAEHAASISSLNGLLKGENCIAWPDWCPHGIRTSKALPIRTILSLLCLLAINRIVIFVKDLGTANPASCLLITQLWLWRFAVSDELGLVERMLYTAFRTQVNVSASSGSVRIRSKLFLYFRQPPC